ncbi:MAG TPA: phosphotransferase, partial [Alkalispirochaeta sp.]|nr:phosphotransferase [Alkalispirochaeta sp.]
MDDLYAQRKAGAFDLLGPREVLSAVEGALDRRLDGTVEPYMSYVNRVYGVRDEDGARVVAKFYRPGRWTEEMIREEHAFLAELAAAEVPVIEPVADGDGETLFELDLDTGAETIPIQYVLFPRKGGRSFDAEGDEEWYRLGAIVGRMHAVAHRKDAPSRNRLEPEWPLHYLEYLLAADVIHPDVREEFVTLCRETIGRVAPRFEAVDVQRIHGDCHRGNILDRPGEGLLLIDFDDMM